MEVVLSCHTFLTLERWGRIKWPGIMKPTIGVRGTKTSKSTENRGTKDVILRTQWSSKAVTHVEVAFILSTRLGLSPDRRPFEHPPASHSFGQLKPTRDIFIQAKSRQCYVPQIRTQTEQKGKDWWLHNVGGEPYFGKDRMGRVVIQWPLKKRRKKKKPKLGLTRRERERNEDITSHKPHTMPLFLRAPSS